MKEVNNIKEFNELMTQEKPVLLDFYADWCGPCQALLPTVEKLADKYADGIEIRKVNVDKNPDLAGHFQVRSIPALFFIRDKKVENKLVGMQQEQALETAIKEQIALA